MLNTVYRLTASRTIEPVVVSQDTTGKVIVRPTYLSICNADQRYYQGTRSKEVLAKKLPMALIHEGIGRVVSDSTGVFQPGDVVVMLPNAPTEQDEFIAENYLRLQPVLRQRFRRVHAGEHDPSAGARGAASAGRELRGGSFHGTRERGYPCYLPLRQNRPWPTRSHRCMGRRQHGLHRLAASAYEIP